MSDTATAEITFKSWPKTARLFRDIVITEKLDGTNAAIGIVRLTPESNVLNYAGHAIVEYAGSTYAVYAQSRKRLITPGDDNYGFARWVYANASALVGQLGEGLHFGEWWGKGIQRGYERDHKCFSLFNARKWRYLNRQPLGDAYLDRVAILYDGPFSEQMIKGALNYLKLYGSYSAPGFKRPEGVCVYFKQADTILKVTLDGEDAGKWEL